MRSNGSNSGTLDLKLPKMIAGDFEPHFSVKHMLKDVLIATRLARSYGLSFGATEAARDSLLAEVRRDRGDYDYASLVHSFFPDGPPGTQRPEEEEVEEQGSLAGLDEAPAAERAAEEPETKAEEVADVPEAEATPEKNDGADVPAPVTGEKAEEPGEPVSEIAEAPEEDGDEAPNETVAEREREPVVAAPVAEVRREEAPPAPQPQPEPAAALPKPEPAAEEKNGERRGFINWIFGRGMDY
jgi:hypothetical protein